MSTPPSARREGRGTLVPASGRGCLAEVALVLGTLLVALVAMARDRRLFAFAGVALVLWALFRLARWGWRRRTPGALSMAVAMPLSIAGGLAAMLHVIRQSPGHQFESIEYLNLSFGFVWLTLFFLPNVWSLGIAGFWLSELWRRPEPARRVTKGAKVVAILVLGSVLAGNVAREVVLRLDPDLAQLAGRR